MSNHEPDRGAAPEPKPCRRAEDLCAMCRGIAEMRVVHSGELLQGQRELLILHAGQIYRLIRTRNDKLILQK